MQHLAECSSHMFGVATGQLIIWWKYAVKCWQASKKQNFKMPYFCHKHWKTFYSLKRDNIRDYTGQIYHLSLLLHLIVVLYTAGSSIYLCERKHLVTIIFMKLSKTIYNITIQRQVSPQTKGQTRYSLLTSVQEEIIVKFTYTPSLFRFSIVWRNVRSSQMGTSDWNRSISLSKETYQIAFPLPRELSCHHKNATWANLKNVIYTKLF